MPNKGACDLLVGRILLLAGATLALSGPALAAPSESAAFPASPEVLRQIKPRSEPRRSQAELIERGRQIFEYETFDGNGRTCATCHPAQNNFTLDPKYIARLRRTDPLFVAETDPRLAELENSAMLRRYALITENVDGFDQPGVLRGVPHVLGLELSLKPGPDFPLTDMTGWSGDGAPRGGSLREFAVGAVEQHFTKSLARVPGRDFRVPTEDELDALLAYQLSLGQHELLDVEPGEEGVLEFRDASAERGMILFDTPVHEGANTSCFSCHYKAGANDEDLDDGGHNNNFATGTNRLPTAPACLLPADGGFGKAPSTSTGGKPGCDAGDPARGIARGDGTFNVPSLVAAAETPPFFHNNSATTLEQAIAFYTTDTFKESPAGEGHAFQLDDADIRDLAAFLRAVNAYENVVEAIRYIDQAVAWPPQRTRPVRSLALLQVNNAISVLGQHKPAPLFATTRAATALYSARVKLMTGNAALLAPAKVDLERARSLMVELGA